MEKTCIDIEIPPGFILIFSKDDKFKGFETTATMTMRLNRKNAISLYELLGETLKALKS